MPDRFVENGAVEVTDGFISAISEKPEYLGFDCGGGTLFPGFIDIHGDMIENELEPRVKVDFPIDVALNHLDARLAACGVTTAYSAVSFSKGARDGERRSFEHTSELIRDIHNRKGILRVDHRIHARFDITFTPAINALESLLTDRKVELVSVMDHTPGQGQYRNLERHIELRAEHYGVSLEEARAIVQERLEKATPIEIILANLKIISRLCKNSKVPLASHDDDTIEKSELMAQLGSVIAEFPVTMEAAETAISRGVMTAMGAPNAMRGQSYSGNLSARELHAAGKLNILASDYHPAAMLPAIRALAKTDPQGLAGAARLISANPAKALDLTDRGEIEVGKRADLIIVDKLDRVVITFSGGQIIYTNSNLNKIN